MTETQERFLRTVLSRVPLDSVVELHLFPPIRRGTLETGVAVIATVLPPAPVAQLMEAETAEAPAGTVEPAPDDESPYLDEPEAEATARDAVAADDAPVSHAPVPHPATPETSDASDASDANDERMANADADADTDTDTESIDIAAPLLIPSPRMRILTAAYRHTIKGVDRGKWSVDVQEEATAPLAAVEAVLRGVRHRSTEPADPEQVSHDALAALVTPLLIAPAAA